MYCNHYLSNYYIDGFLKFKSNLVTQIASLDRKKQAPEISSDVLAFSPWPTKRFQVSYVTSTFETWTTVIIL